ncbi:IS701 family transposase [Streptomyces sp. NPDC059906]|uniref:IS701 family transposase n=1 Tax=Streptomyces sp. NPDC059906 TaxID=3346997 RepID=UPI003668586F
MIESVGPGPSTRLFASLRRRDQRTKAELYLRGLLATEGRKSVRNMSASLQGAGDGATEQSLHHFITSSTWGWRPVREALAGTLADRAPQHVWAVRALPIPKAGTHSVGVDRLYVPGLGQSVHGQLAFGLWYAAEGRTTPVDWRLHLPASWLDDARRRARADIPPAAVFEDLDECAVALALGLPARTGTRRPVVLDHVAARPGALTATLARADVPFLARITDRTPLTAADPALPGAGAGPLPAGRLLQAVRGLGRPAHWPDPAGRPARRTSLVAAIPVRAGRSACGHRPLVLLGEWDDIRRPPCALWLARVPGASAGALLGMTKLAARVAHDGESLGDRVGLRDFEGRSFPGWHRHMTLASVAHAWSTPEPAPATELGYEFSLSA